MSIARSYQPRDLYLKKLVAFKDSEPVKVITGIRRCGKSSLLKLMIAHLIEEGISDEQIVEMNFESYEFRSMDSDALYQYIKSKYHGQRLYLFFDEIQRIHEWEDAVNAFRVDIDCDIYLTGSNAYLLSSEYSTYLSGRCIEIKMLPLSFKEFLTFHKFRFQETASSLCNNHSVVYDRFGELFHIQDVFKLYLQYGGMPGMIDVGLDQEKALILLDGIYSTVVMRDILEREKRRGLRQLSDAILLRKIILFLADNIGNTVSMNAIGNTFIHEGLLTKSKSGSPSTHTIQAYVNALTESFIFYEIKLFDIKGKEYLRTLGKYYIADVGLRNYLLGFRNRDTGHILENVVYFELIRRGYDVAVGKIDNLEIDFVAQNAQSKCYIQVTESLLSQDVRNRELSPLMKIRDNYPKMILTMDAGIETDFEGIYAVNLVDWLLNE